MAINIKIGQNSIHNRVKGGIIFRGDACHDVTTWNTESEQRLTHEHTHFHIYNIHIELIVFKQIKQN